MVKIDYKVCNRCEGAREKRCQRICPGDLIGVNPEDDRPVVLYPEDCWACTACVKDCPVAAITLKLPFQVLEKGASLRATAKGRKTSWVLEGTDGKKEEFEIIVDSRQDTGKNQKLFPHCLLFKKEDRLSD